MGQFDEHLQATANADEFERLLLEEFRSAWDNAIGRISPPDLSSFLSKGGDGDFSQLALRLQQLDSEYRNRLQFGDTPRPTGNSTANQGFAEMQTVLKANAEMDSAEEPSTDDPSSAAFAQTVNYVPEPDSELNEPNSPHAETIIGDTAQADNDPTDDALGGKGSGSPGRQMVAGYQVLGVLGRGGMGVVYRALHLGLNRLVALKMILHGKHVGRELLSRFQAEAEAVAQLQHPNIVQIYDIGTHEGLPFFSLELVDGPSLATEQAGQPMMPVRAAELLETLARAMHYAHIRGIVHRDLKPANILLTSQGVPKVTDFGLVKRIEGEDSEMTGTGVIMGTPSYMAPEQASASKEIGPLADVYSLGATLYCLLTGRPPFIGPTALETVMLLRQQEPIPPSKMQPNLPRDLETICLKCLQKEPEKRYASAEHLADDLHRFLAKEPILARPVGKAERVWRWCTRNPALAWSGGVALVLALCLMIGGPLAAIVINKERGAAVEAQGRAEKNELLAKENATLAKDQRDLAVTSLELLVERLPTDLKNIPGTEAIKRSLLLTAMDGLNKVGNVGGEKSRDFVMAKAFAKMGETLLEVGETKSARQQFEQSHAMLLELAKTETETSAETHHLRLGRSYRNLGRAVERIDGGKAAYLLFKDSLREREAALSIASDPLFVKQEIAESYGELGRVALDLGRPHEAMESLTKSIDLRREWLEKSPGNEEAIRAQAGSLRMLGHAYLNQGNPTEAAKKFQAAIASLNQVLKPNDPEDTDRTNIAISYTDWGTACLFSGDSATALKHFREAVARLEPLFRANNRSMFLLRKLGQAYYFAGTACQMVNDPEAPRFMERSTTARKLVFERTAQEKASRQDYMLALARSGQIAAAVEQAEELAKEAAKEPDALFVIACTYALCAAESERSKNISSPDNKAEEFQAKSLAALREAVKQGYEAHAMLKQDPDLAGVRSHPIFQQVIDELEKRLPDNTQTSNE